MRQGYFFVQGENAYLDELSSKTKKKSNPKSPSKTWPNEQ